MARCPHSSGVSKVGLRRSLSGSNSSKSGVAPGYPFGRAGSTESHAATLCPQLIVKAGSATSLDSAALRNGKGLGDRTGFPLLDGLVVLDQWKRVVEMVEECAPFLVLLGLSESDRVVV